MIKTATPQDIEELQVIADAAQSRKDPDYFKKCIEERDVFIISHDDMPAGYCMLNWAPKYQPFRSMDIPEIQDLNVIPEKRRLGLATALIDHCEKQAIGKDSDMIGIGVGMTKDYGYAQRLYVKLGYMPDGNGLTYDRQGVSHGQTIIIDDELSLMMIKNL